MKSHSQMINSSSYGSHDFELDENAVLENSSFDVVSDSIALGSNSAVKNLYFGALSSPEGMFNIFCFGIHYWFKSGVKFDFKDALKETNKDHNGTLPTSDPFTCHHRFNDVDDFMNKVKF